VVWYCLWYEISDYKSICPIWLVATGIPAYILRVNTSQAVSQMVLATIRQITRAIGLRSRQLAKTVGLSVPQLVVLKEVAENGETAIGHVAKQVSLSQATVTTIVDRLEQHEMVVRRRDNVDRRKVLIAATESGRAIVASNPTILQEEFTESFEKLERWEQTQILSSLQRVSTMMNAQQIPSALVLPDEPWHGEELAPTQDPPTS
jgi:DNA-binding MarR family transcriptional regulator